MIDTHCHLLNSVDDGSQSKEWTLTMLRSAVASGISQIIATPHCWPDIRYTNDQKNIQPAFDEALRLIEEHKLDLRLYMGCELFMTDDTLAWIKSGRALSLNDSLYYLIELPWSSPQAEAPLQTAYLQTILDMGKRILIAHPERYSVLVNDFTLVQKWRDMGCYFQINRTSLIDPNCWEYEMAWKLVNAGYVDIIASDAHQARGKRILVLDDIYALLKEKFGEHKVKLWFKENPQKIIDNELIEIPKD